MLHEARRVDFKRGRIEPDDRVGRGDRPRVIPLRVEPVDNTRRAVVGQADQPNRLTTVTFKNNSSVITDEVQYYYDHANRWIRKTTDDDGHGTGAAVDSSTVFIYDGNQIVLHFEADGAADLIDTDLAHRYLWGPVRDQLLVDESVSGLGTAGVRHWTLGDHIGSIRDVINDNGDMELHRLFNAYGQSSVAQGDPESYTPLFSFTARPFDLATLLQSNGNRWYDALVAKWLSEDPIGFGGGDANLYRYVGNRPTNAVDPTGLWTSRGLLKAYRAAYGNEQLAKMITVMAEKHVKIVGACSWAHDWWKKNDTVYIGTTAWFGSERSNENAAAQLNEAMAIHYDLGKTEFFYKVGRVFRGTGKFVGGGLSIAGGVVLSETLAGAVIGVPIAVFGTSTAGEGLTQIFGVGEGENGYNIGAEAVGAIGDFVGGEEGRQYATTTYYLADLGFSVAGGISALSKAGSTPRFKFVAKYHYLGPADKAKVYNAVGNNFVRAGKQVSIPWKLRLTGHSIEAVVAGHATVEDLNSLGAGKRLDVRLGGMSAAEARRILNDR